MEERTAERTLLFFAAAVAALSGATALYEEGGPVVLLTADTLDGEGLGGPGAFAVVEFYAPWCGHCKKLAPEYAKAAKALLGTATLAAVDCDAEDNKDACSTHGVKGFPTLKYGPVDATGKWEPADLSARDADGIVQAVKEKLGGASASGVVKALKYADTHFWLNNDEVPKALLLTRDAALPSWARSLAVKYKSGKTFSARFAHASAATEPLLAKRFGVEDASLPALIAIDVKSGFFTLLDDAEALEAGGGKAVKAGKALVDGLSKTAEGERKALPSFPPPDVPRKQAEPKYARLTEDNYHTGCFGPNVGATCVVYCVPSQGTDEHEHEKTLMAVAKSHRNDPLVFVWTDTDTQGDFCKALGMEGPGAAAVKAGKRPRAAKHEGALEPKALSAWLEKVLSGDARYTRLEGGLPELEPDYLRNV